MNSACAEVLPAAKRSYGAKAPPRRAGPHILLASIRFRCSITGSVWTHQTQEPLRGAGPPGTLQLLAADQAAERSEIGLRALQRLVQRRDLLLRAE